MRIQIINGPNLNLLGQREPKIYGELCFEDFLTALRNEFASDEIYFYQSNIEGEIINHMQEVDGKCDGIILNAGGYTHTSVAIHDCIRAISVPVIEVHISNIYGREEYRRQSLLSPVCCGVICGFGLNSYKLAIHALRA